MCIRDRGRGRERRGVGGRAAERVDRGGELGEGLVVSCLLEGCEGVARVLVEDLVRRASVDDVAGGGGAVVMGCWREGGRGLNE